jgi:hypothetical protein
MIPKKLKVEHVLQAITEIDGNGVPPLRAASVFDLIYKLYKGRTYPPKYVVSLANKYANGSELKSQEFHGGVETNSFLQRLSDDFKIMDFRSVASV